MQSELVQKSKRDLETQKQKYEQMLDELKRQLAGDKEFVVNELRAKILALEKQVMDMREQHYKEQEAMLQQQKDLVLKHENQMAELKQGFETKLS